MRKLSLLNLTLLISAMFISNVYPLGFREDKSLTPEPIGLAIAIDENNQIYFMHQKCTLGQLEDKISQFKKSLAEVPNLEVEPKVLISIGVKKSADQQVVQQVFDICKKIKGAKFNVNGVYLNTPRMPTQVEIKKMLNYGLSQNGRAMRVPFNKILLIRQGSTYGAMKIIKSGEDFLEYEWYYQGDGTGDFTSKTATYGTGKVFAKYKEIEISPIEYQVVEEGDKQFIEFGIFRLEWSQGNWIYFPGKEDAKNPIEIALTDNEDVQKIDVTSPELKFYKIKRDK